MITVTNLTKRYGGNVLAVNNVSFTAPTGSVTGFLGPNGAGKSTTMRCLVGLTKATSGEATIFGSSYQNLANPAARVGVLLDASAQHAGRTGREILSLGALTIGAPSSRVDEVIELVGLTVKESKARVGTYSLGMRQRLGIGHALIGNPEVLILDEPANGLDPHGILWMRGLLRSFADAGGTVLLSSHLLHEVQQTADRIVMIGRGEIVADGTTQELIAEHGDLEEMFLERTAATSREGFAA